MPNRPQLPEPEPWKEGCVLALDQGGHASRAIVFDGKGAELAKGMCEVAERRPREDRVEQDPEEVVASIHSAIAAALRALGGSASSIVAAGLATQRSSLVCWDRESGEPLSPVISWQDRRASAWLERYTPRAAEIRARTGLYLSAHYGASKMRWCLDHLPRVKRAREAGRLAIGPLATFLAYRLLDERPFVVDPANASRTLLWNVHTLDWDPELLELFCIPRFELPRCVSTRRTIGRIDIGGRAVPLTVLTGDQSAAIFARGRPQSDTAYVNLGTGAFVQRPIEGALPDLPRLLASVVLLEGDAATRVIEGTINGAGSALRWIAGQLGIADVESQLGGWLRDAKDPPLFLNGVSGLAAPYWAPRFRSRFIGEGDGAQKVVAVLESVLFLVQAILEEMDGAIPRAACIQVSGGLAQVDALCQLLADVSGIPVRRAVEHEATARGLAWLMQGDQAGWPKDEGESADRFEPAPNDPLHARYRAWRAAMYHALARPE